MMQLFTQTHHHKPVYNSNIHDIHGLLQITMKSSSSSNSNVDVCKEYIIYYVYWRERRKYSNFDLYL